MRWQLAGDWPVGPTLIPTGTVLDGATPGGVISLSFRRTEAFRFFKRSAALTRSPVVNPSVNRFAVDPSCAQSRSTTASDRTVPARRASHDVVTQRAPLPAERAGLFTDGLIERPLRPAITKINLT